MYEEHRMQRLTSVRMSSFSCNTFTRKSSLGEMYNFDVDEGTGGTLLFSRTKKEKGGAEML